MVGSAQQGVEDRLDRKHVGAGLAQGGECDRLVVGPARPDRIREQGHAHTLGEDLHRGLMDANGALDPGKQQVVDAEIAQGGKQARGGESREGVLGEDRGSLTRGGQQTGLGAAELGRDLLGEEHGKPEEAGGADRQANAARHLVTAGDSAEEGGLGVDDKEGGGHPGDLREAPAPHNLARGA